VLHEKWMDKEQCYMRSRWLRKVLREEQMAREQCYMRSRWLRNSVK